MPTLLSWNLFGLEEHRLDERMEAACLALLLTDSPPDVVCLQEVVDRSLAAHLRPHFSHAGYAAAIQPPSGEYYVGVFVRRPLVPVKAEFLRFPHSDQGRGLLELELEEEQEKGKRWWVQTAHLESGPQAGPQRQAQLGFCLDRLQAVDGPGVFAGDTNLREAEARAELQARPIQDAWVATGSPAAHRGTWRPTGRTGPSRWFRFDRIYGNRHVRFADLITRSATTETAPTVPVSDHLALQCTVSREP